MKAANTPMNIVIRDQVADRIWADRSHSRLVRVHHRYPKRTATGQWIVVGSLADMLNDEEELTAARQLPADQTRFVLFDRQAPPEMFPQVVRLNIRSPERLHLVRLESDTLEGFLGRLMSTLSSEQRDQRILDAWWEGQVLVAISPGFKRLRVPLEKLPRRLQALPADQRNAFDIDGDGEFLYWPGCDVHMGWSQLQQAIDPAAVAAAKQSDEAFRSRYGAAIRALRNESGLKQSDVPNLSAKTISRIETGQTRASAKALAGLAEAHDMSLNDYLAAVAERMVTK